MRAPTSSMEVMAMTNCSAIASGRCAGRREKGNPDMRSTEEALWELIYNK